jgi:hypothetical protein
MVTLTICTISSTTHVFTVVIAIVMFSWDISPTQSGGWVKIFWREMLLPSSG